MNNRHALRRILTTIVGTLMLAALMVSGASAHSRYHARPRAALHVTSVRQSNVIQQSNTNSVTIAARGGDATATCSASGNPTGTGLGAGVALNLNLCANTATGGTAVAANTGTIAQSGTNTATASNTSTITR
jgi:hypothetical protein